jgi:hypothetical protein
MASFLELLPCFFAGEKRDKAQLVTCQQPARAGAIVASDRHDELLGTPAADRHFNAPLVG